MNLNCVLWHYTLNVKSHHRLTFWEIAKCELVVEPLGAGLSWRKWVPGGLTDLQGYSLALTAIGFLLSNPPTSEQTQAARA